MRTAKDCVKIFSAIGKDEPIGLWYLEKSDVIEKLEGYELEDKDGNLIEPTDIVNDSFVNDVIDMISNDDYLWERFSETVSDCIFDLAKTRIEEINDDKELWDNEQEKVNG